MDSFESRMNPRFLAESEKGMLWEPRVIESGRETVEGFKEDERGKRGSPPPPPPPCLIKKRGGNGVVQFELVFRHSCYVVCACTEFFGEVGHFTERSGFLEPCVSFAKSWWFTEWLAMILERGVVYRTKRMGPSTEPWGTPYMSSDGDKDDYWPWSGLISVWEVWLKPLECQKQSSGGRGELDLVVNSVKSGRKIQQKKNRNAVIVQSRENIVYST